MLRWFVIYLALIGLFVFTTSQEYEDNDFAEFEDFDEVESKPMKVSNEGKTDSESQGSDNEGKVKNTVNNNNDDDDDFYSNDDQQEVTVEDEDDGDEFSHLNDAEEFIGYNSDFPKGNKPKGQDEPQITFTQVPLHLRSNWDSFYLEMIMIAGLIIYFINFIFGKSKNQKLANAWYNSHATLLQNNFALVGSEEKQEGSENGLLKESENVYTLWCSGRTNVEWMLVELKFIKRQDLIGLFTQLIRPSSDQLLIKVHVEDMDSYVFAVASKKTAARLTKDMTDISTFCADKKSVDKYGLNQPLVLMSEIGEVAAAVLGDPKVTAIINKYIDMFDFFHFSDQYSGPKQQEDTQPTKLPEVSKTLLFGFNFPGRGHPSLEAIDNMRPLLQLVFHVTDKLRKFKLSREGKAKAEKNRARVEDSFLKATHAARAEMAQAKREEKRRAEREKMLEIDDPDKQRKWEEREHRRTQRRRAPKMKQLKVS